MMQHLLFYKKKQKTNSRLDEKELKNHHYQTVMLYTNKQSKLYIEAIIKL